MTERGIDKELAEFVQLEIENKQRRERARCLKDIIGFLKKKVENGDDVPEIQS